jgi:hypothetical protein
MRDHESDLADLIAAAMEQAGLSRRPKGRISAPRHGPSLASSAPEALSDPGSIENLGDTRSLYQRRDDPAPSLADLEAILHAAAAAQARSIFAQAVANGELTELPMEIGSPEPFLAFVPICRRPDLN